jgi:hypothetical protein
MKNPLLLDVCKIPPTSNLPSRGQIQFHMGSWYQEEIHLRRLLYPHLQPQKVPKNSAGHQYPTLPPQAINSR